MSEKRKAAPVWPVPLSSPGTAIGRGKRATREDPSRPPKLIKTVCAADVEPEEVRWVWYPYIPAGRITCIEGDPGLGKSWISCAIASAISNGEPLPGQDFAPPPQKVLMMSAEDGLADVLVPRLAVLGANLKNIILTNEFFTLDPDGIRDLEKTMKECSAALVFIDPVVAYMGGKIDMHRANEVRGLMAALHEAATRTGAAIVIVRHLRKGGAGGKAIYGGIGSIDFTAACRSVLLVDTSKAGDRLVRHIKCNNAPLGYARTYVLDHDHFHWGEELDASAEADAISTTPKKKTQDATRFIFDTLRDGPIPAMEVLERAEKMGISTRTLHAAKAGLARSRKEKGGGWVWELLPPEEMAKPVD